MLRIGVEGQVQPKGKPGPWAQTGRSAEAMLAGTSLVTAIFASASL